MAADPRRIVGSMVEAKECHVTNLTECARRYGSNSKTRRVQGIITHVEVIKNSTTNRTTTFVTCIPAPSFGLTGMPRKWFDDLWMCIRFSEQPPNRPSDMTSEQYCWRLVDDFVKNFNEHRAQNFFPSDEICVDESMSRWYGQGGHWINHGLPMYVAIDRKPENGCEIQNAACGRSGVIIRLKIVKTAEEENASAVKEDDGNNHGTNVLKFLVEPWVRTDRCVCADSYFASVNAVTVMRMMGLRFNCPTCPTLSWSSVGTTRDW